MKKILFVFICLLSVSNLFAQLRTFNAIFPNISAEIRSASFSEKGHVSYSEKATQDTLIGGSKSGIPSQITTNVLNKKSGFYIESIRVFPCNTANITMLDIYNALGNIQGLKGILYDSYTRGKPTPLFEDATRIVSQSKTSSIPDPAPASSLPESETIYIKLKDVNFGNTYYRGEITPFPYGLSYSLTNFKAITYFLVSVIKAEKFTTQLYIEPVREGILVYSIAGVDFSDFASNRIDVDSAIAKRLGVINGWASGEILKKVNNENRAGYICLRRWKIRRRNVFN